MGYETIAQCKGREGTLVNNACSGYLPFVTPIHKASTGIFKGLLITRHQPLELYTKPPRYLYVKTLDDG